MKKVIYISVVLVIFLFVAAGNSFACSCALSDEPVKKQIDKAFTGSVAIFSGEVLEISESTEDKDNLTVKFKVAQSWKGNSKSEITITTAKESSMCGYSFEVGKKYLVYANGLKDKLSAYNCSRTSSNTGTSGDSKYLTKLKKKKPKTS